MECRHTLNPNFKNKRYIRNKKSDIYSLGVLLWEISSDKPPFSDYEGYAIVIEISKDKRETPIKGTPSDYVQLYKRCWDSDPSSRPDIEEVHSILTRLKSQYTVEQPDSKNFDNLNLMDQAQTDNINPEKQNSKCYMDYCRSQHRLGF